MCYLKLVLCFAFVNCLAIAKQDDRKRLIYYCGNRADKPWDENSDLACSGSFYPAVLDSLFYIDHNAELKSDILDTFRWDYKNKHYKLKLKDNLYFHNKRKVNAKDLEFSILRYFFVFKPSIGNTFHLNIKGTKKISKGQKFESGLVEGVKIIDDLTIALVPAKANPSFLYTFTHFSFALVPKEELKEDYITWKEWPIGLGAYKVVDFNKKEKSVTLLLNNKKNYPNAAEEVLFQQERKIEPDITIKDFLASKSNKYVKERLLVPMYRRVIEFNFNSEYGRSKEFRRAIALAISREELVKKTYIPTNPLYEILLSSSLGRINIKESQNINEAKKVITLITKNKKNVFLIPYSEDLSYLGAEYRNILKKQLENVGINILFIENNKNIWDPFSIEFLNAPFYIHSTEGDYYDPILNFTKYKKGSPSQNSFLKDDLIEVLLEETKEAPSRDILNERLKNISRYFYEQRILVPLFEIPSIVYYKKEKIKSIGRQFGGITLYLQNIEVKK